MATIAWLLNLDAELELGCPEHYRPSPAMEARIAALRPRLHLLAPGDRVIANGADLSGAAHALAFCPTPSALTRIAKASLRPPPAPPLAVLRRVNARAFSAELGQTLAGAVYVRSMAELAEVLRARSPSGVWLLKRDFGFAGRERRRVYGATPDAPTLGFARRSFARGEGLQVEPELARTHDFAQHGYVLPDGEVLLGSPQRQECDRRGAWLRSDPLAPGELHETEQAELARRAHEAGRALAAAGYFGPFGIDAFRFDDPAGGRAFQPRSEINARFSMGYPRALLELSLARSEVR